MTHPDEPSLRPGPVVLCTDFGPGSSYVGQMKLVIDRVAPGVQVIDLAHDLPPQRPTAAALIVGRALEFVSPGTVVCVVVDPGVGSDRRLCIVRPREHVLAVVPDNGLARVLHGTPNPPIAITRFEPFALPRVSPVFHGRDIFAPIAARLAMGLDPSELGDPIPQDELGVLDPPLARPPQEGIDVVYVDPFGNLITSLRGEAIPERTAALCVDGHRAPLVEYYAQAPPGSLIALVGSFGHVEVALQGGSAARRLGIGIGHPVTLVSCDRPHG